MNKLYICKFYNIKWNDISPDIRNRMKCRYENFPYCINNCYHGKPHIRNRSCKYIPKCVPHKEEIEFIEVDEFEI